MQVEYLSVGVNAPAFDQLLGWMYFMAKSIEFKNDPEDDERVVLKEEDIKELEGIDWEPLLSFYPFAKYVEMTKNNLEFYDYPAEEVCVYYGMKKLGLFSFSGYSIMLMEWNNDYEALLYEEGLNYIQEQLRSSQKYVITKRVAFMKCDDGNQHCVNVINVTTKKLDLTRTEFLSGCGHLLKSKFMGIGIDAVIFKFNSVPKPYDCVIYPKISSLTPASVENLKRITAPDRIVANFSKLMLEQPELNLDMELEDSSEEEEE